MCGTGGGWTRELHDEVCASFFRLISRWTSLEIGDHRALTSSAESLRWNVERLQQRTHL